MLPSSYRKVVATRFSKNFRKAAQVVEAPLELPGAGELLIRVHYAGVNATDVNISAGLYTPGKEPPIDLGSEVVGEVVAVGAGVEDFEPGMMVTSTSLGGYAEYYTCRARYAIPVAEATPQILSLVLSGSTAALGLDVGEMRSGETVLVTAAAGGTGQFAVQLAKLAGNHVIGTCGSPAKAALLRALGCDRVINYREETLGAVLKAEYPRGLDLVYESVGREMFDTCVENLAIRGRLVVIGFISEYLAAPEVVHSPRIYGKLLGKSASIRSMFLLHFIRQVPEHFRHLLALYDTGKLRAAVDTTRFHGVEQVADAVEHLHSGRSNGKVVVRMVDDEG
jgi:NADPH-dependent curcumin reductase CurA